MPCYFLPIFLTIASFVTFVMIGSRFPIPPAKIILGYFFIKYALFDYFYNIIRGESLMHYDNNVYGEIMTSLSSWGVFMKFVLGIVAIAFLVGLN